MSSHTEQHDIWEALADHFLDSETRYQVPATALRCVNANLAVDDAERIWRYEVTPAVWPNLWDVAGEWGMWDREWLVARIEAKRGRWPNRPGAFAYLVYRQRVHFAHRGWCAIAACMRVLIAAPAGARAQLAQDLEWLARHFFEFLPCGEASATRRRELRRLYVTTFLPIFKTLVVCEAFAGEKARQTHSTLAPEALMTGANFCSSAAR